MFLVAMHLIYKKKLDPSVKMPDQVPTELYVSASEDDKKQEMLASGIDLDSLDLNPTLPSQPSRNTEVAAAAPSQFSFDFPISTAPV